MNTMMKRLAFLMAALMLLSGCRPASPAMNATPEPNPSVDVPSGVQEADAVVQEASEPEPDEAQTDPGLPEPEPTEEKTMHLNINGADVPVLWEGNESVDALIALVRDTPLTIQMSPYGGFEQVGPIGQSLPRNDAQTTTQPGDLVLYSGNQIVAFYGSNSWAYTRLGRIADKSESELAELLGGSGVSLTLSWE